MRGGRPEFHREHWIENRTLERRGRQDFERRRYARGSAPHIAITTNGDSTM
jgi:hypothetical protein